MDLVTTEVTETHIDDLEVTTQLSVNTTQLSVNTTQLLVNTTKLSVNTTQLSVNTTRLSVNTTQLSFNTTQVDIATETVGTGEAKGGDDLFSYLYPSLRKGGEDDVLVTAATTLNTTTVEPPTPVKVFFGIFPEEAGTTATEDFTDSVLKLINGLDWVTTSGTSTTEAYNRREDASTRVFKNLHTNRSNFSNGETDVVDSVLAMLYEDVTDSVMKLLYSPNSVDLTEYNSRSNNNSIDNWINFTSTKSGVDFNLGEESELADYSTDYDYNLGELITIAILCIPSSLAVILYIISEPSRWTGVNLVLCWSRLVSLGCLVFPLARVLFMRDLVCVSLHLLLPALVLHEKIALTSAALLRYLYINRTDCWFSLPLLLRFILIVIPGMACVAGPFITLLAELPVVFSVCMEFEMSRFGHTKMLLAVYMMVWGGSLLIDLCCYIRIASYMKTMRLRVSTEPESDEESRKVMNMISSTTSLLIWLISCVSMLPTIFMLYRSNMAMNYSEERMFGAYHLITILTFNLIVPLILIGSNIDMRLRLKHMHNQFEKFTHRTFGFGREEPRAEAYALNNNVNHQNGRPG